MYAYACSSVDSLFQKIRTHAPSVFVCCIDSARNKLCNVTILLNQLLGRNYVTVAQLRPHLLQFIL